MSRQIFTRLISSFRGELRTFDYAPHIAARYDVCGGPFPADRCLRNNPLARYNQFERRQGDHRQVGRFCNLNSDIPISTCTTIHLGLFTTVELFLSSSGL